MTFLRIKDYSLFLALLLTTLLACGCVVSKQIVSGAAAIDSTAAACVYVAKELDRKFSLKGLTIQVVDENIQERQTGLKLPYSKILTDGLTRELANRGAIISVLENGDQPLVIYASYFRPDTGVIIDVKLRQFDFNRGTTKERAIAEVAVPRDGLKSQWFQPTLPILADALVRQLGENYVSGDLFKLKMVSSMPGTAGQPSLQLGRSFDGALQEAVSRTQVLPLSITSQKEVLLCSSYILSGKTVHYKSWLETPTGKLLATATTSMRKNLLPADVFKPMASKALTACLRYERLNSKEPPKDSAEAKQLEQSIRKYLQELGIKSTPCATTASSLPHIVGSIHLPPIKSTKDGYKLSTVIIKVRILDGKGLQLGSFDNQASRGFANNRSKANTRAIIKAADKGLKEQLAKSLLSISSQGSTCTNR